MRKYENSEKRKGGAMLYNIDTLRAALLETNKGLDGEAGADAAYEVMLNLGRLRLSGTAIPDDVKGFDNLNIALTATTHMRWVIKMLTDLIGELLTSKETGFYEEDSAMSILRSRHNLWCAEKAVVEVNNALSQKGEASSELTDKLAKVITDLAKLDALMIKADLFGAAAELPLLQNLRKVTLTQSLPWWLDGTIEADTKRRMEKFVTSLPDPRRIEAVMKRSH